MGRAEVVARVAGRIAARDVGHPLRVGVDGVCGAGKTTFAHDLAVALAGSGRPVIELDSDGFHHVRARRHRRSEDPARGYSEDAYDLDALRDLVLRPLGSAGPFRYAEHVHDLVTDEVAPRFAVAAPDAVVLFACTFIQRGALRDDWDEVIWLDVPEEVATARGVARDAEALGGVRAAEAAYATRYAAACWIYLAEERPSARASIVIDHTDPAQPLLVRDVGCPG